MSRKSSCRLIAALWFVLLPSYLYDGHILPTPRQNALEQPASLSADERCIAWAIHDEARGEPLRGARAVMDVILKRMATRGKSACEIIAQPGQFSGYRHNFVKNISSKSLARFLKVRSMQPVVKDAEYFHAEYVQPGWARGVEVVAKIGRHVFYKERK